MTLEGYPWLGLYEVSRCDSLHVTLTVNYTTNAKNVRHTLEAAARINTMHLRSFPLSLCYYARPITTHKTFREIPEWGREGPIPTCNRLCQ